MATPAEFVPWRDIEPERSDHWITTKEAEADLEEAQQWQEEAHADKEFYDNDAYWFPPVAMDYTAYSRERG